MSARPNAEVSPRLTDTAALARTALGVTAGTLLLSSLGPLASVGAVLLVRPWALGPRADHALAATLAAQIAFPLLSAWLELTFPIVQSLGEGYAKTALLTVIPIVG